MNQDISSLLLMDGKVALVTGASSGLGAHFSKVLANAGAKVVLAARRKDRLDELVNSITAAGGEALAVSMDVTNNDSVEEALNAIEKHWGVVDVLINNAGVAESRQCLKVDEQSWDYVINTNLKSAWRVARSMAERCIKSEKSGSIVNIASILGLRPGFGQSAYGVSKAGLIHLTKSMALELGGKNFRVNALCPGYFETEMNSEYLRSDAGKAYMQTTPSKRSGHLDELTGPILLLAGDAGSYINGIALAVDGGHLVTSL